MHVCLEGIALDSHLLGQAEEVLGWQSRKIIQPAVVESAIYLL